MDQTLQKMAMKAYLEARQRADLRRDIAARFLLGEGPFELGDRVNYWQIDNSNIKTRQDVGTRQGSYHKKELFDLLTPDRQFFGLTSQNCGRKNC